MSQDEDDPVGYGRPPKHSRFKPGQSGNPRGRPKGTRNLHGLLKAELLAPLTVTIDGRRRRLPAYLVMFKQLVAKGMKGDPRATKMITEIAETHLPELFTPDTIANPTESDQQIIARFLAGYNLEPDKS